MSETSDASSDILTAEEAATYLRVTTATIYRLAVAGKIPAARIGRGWRFSRRLLDEWLSTQMNNSLASGEQAKRNNEV